MTYEYKIRLIAFFAFLKKKQTPRKASFYFFSTEKLTRLFLSKEVMPSSDCKVIKPLIF